MFETIGKFILGYVILLIIVGFMLSITESEVIGGLFFLLFLPIIIPFGALLISTSSAKNNFG